MYRYNETGEIIRARDGACIPRDLHNADYAAIVEAGFEIAPFEPTDSPFEGLEQAEHDEWLIETAARRALAALKQGEPDEQAPQGREQDEAAGRAGNSDLDSSVGDSGSDGSGAGPVRSLELQLEDALTKDAGKLFPPAPDPIDVARAINARLLHKDDDLPAPGAPSDWDMDGQGVVEAMPAASNVPPEIAALLDNGETLTRDVRRKLTERLNVELAELKNLRGLAGEDLKREAEIEKLLGLFARLGEI